MPDRPLLAYAGLEATRVVGERCRIRARDPHQVRNNGDVMTTSPTTRSARDLLVEWANNQDGWVRAIVGEALVSRRELSAEVLDRVKELFLIEKQLADGEPIDPQPLGDVEGSEDPRQDLRLLSLRECRGVNALAEDQAVDFNPRMTILFGENATGKTGYVRVFKSVANVRSAEKIIPDIHRATPPPEPEAVLRYALGDAEHELAWKGETGVPPLTRLSVFDAPAVALHLEEDLTYVYTPADLALFRYVHVAIEGVRARLEQERTAQEPRQNPFLTAFARDSSIYPQIEQLGATTDVGELERLGTVDEKERAELEDLKTSVEALASDNSSGHAEILRNRIAVLRGLSVLARAATEFKVDELSTAMVEHTQAAAAQETAAAAVFSGGDLPSAVRPAWQAFVEAGESYLRSSGLDAYPKSEDPCIYCRQSLEAPAEGLLRSYREYASGTAAAAVDAAAARVSAARAPVLTSEVESALGTSRTLLPGIEEAEEPPDWGSTGHQLVESMEMLRRHFGSENPDPSEPLPDVSEPSALAHRLSGPLAEAEATLKGLEGNVRER
jgi:hypothetical protein